MHKEDLENCVDTLREAQSYAWEEHPELAERLGEMADELDEFMDELPEYEEDEDD